MWSPGYRPPPGDGAVSFSLKADPVGVTKSRRKWTESYIGLLQAAKKKKGGKQGKQGTYFAKSNGFID